MNRIYSYQRNYTHDLRGFTTNMYMRNTLNVKRRNTILWPIPTMYAIADGNRIHLMESYNKLTFVDVGRYESKQQVMVTTVRHNVKTLPTLMEFVAPNLYGMLIYSDHLLSPFHRKNRRYYKYGIAINNESEATLFFKPRFTDNTQLVSGKAKVDMSTGRIISVEMNGEYDMLRFHSQMEMGDVGRGSLLPKHNKTDAVFKFLGNHIVATFETFSDCPVTLPDSIDNSHDHALMEQLRPYPLTAEQQKIVDDYDRAHPTTPEDTTQADTVVKKRWSLGKFLQHGIGDNLVTSIRAYSENYSFKLSPILNPQYLSYSNRRGLAYKIKLGASYYFNRYRYFEFDPVLGYNFKLKKFYFTTPLRFNYNPKRNGYVEVVYGNGNRISNSSVLEEIIHEHNDTLQFDDNTQLDAFDDNYLQITNNIMAYDWLDIETGLTIHQRKAAAPEEMARYHKPTEYRSFAPLLKLKITPWRTGPLFTINYERGIKGINKSNIGYERWEWDASIKYKFHLMRKLNIRLGGGFYPNKEDNYFVDYANFHDNNLPDGWDDDWTGNFQLLNSQWYNESRYYARVHASYESPLLFATWLPLVGHYIETERLYFSALSIEHTRPYFELGYGLTNRVFSIGLFASFLNTKFQSAECKFTFELFHRW